MGTDVGGTDGVVTVADGVWALEVEALGTDGMVTMVDGVWAFEVEALGDLFLEGEEVVSSL